MPFLSYTEINFTFTRSQVSTELQSSRTEASITSRRINASMLAVVFLFSTFVDICGERNWMLNSACTSKNYSLTIGHDKLHTLQLLTTDNFILETKMATKMPGKINDKLMFLYKKQNYLDKSFCRLLLKALILSHFDYACPSWYPGIQG